MSIHTRDISLSDDTIYLSLVSFDHRTYNIEA